MKMQLKETDENAEKTLEALVRVIISGYLPRLPVTVKLQTRLSALFYASDRFLALPNELIHTVAGHTESRDLFSLCQTNRQIHNICLEWIYRRITVNDPARLVQCCKTIVLHAEAADLVRKLTILSAIPYNATPSTSNLIQIDEDTLFGSLQPIRMPKLQVFLGPASLAYVVIPGSPTLRMLIHWESNRSTSSSDGVATLARSAVDVLLIQNLVVGWDRQLLSTITAHMPRLKRLMFRNLGNCEDEKSITLLAGFTADPHDRNAREEFEAVRRWAEIAPMLTDVTFPSNTPWMYLPLPLGLWLPGIDGARFKLEDLNVKLFYTAVLTSPVALPPMYHVLAKKIAGPDALLIVEKAINSGEAIPDFEPTQNPRRPFRLLVSNDDA
ncbi:hypothetical protein C8R44DRAFT_739236 [Mycena epipterygia]|nr:hypothetical protein C8R44DRAFT_739236 [Mycena epipterygia]